VAREPNLAGSVIMMLTSADRQEDASRCRELGMAAYLVKPVKAGELRKAISRALGTESIADGATVAPPPTDPITRPLRILLAEDNAINQRVAIRMLEPFGHTIVIVNHGGEAVAAVSRERFDVILMDVQMPEVDGLEATRLIRLGELSGGHRTPIVAMTAHAMTGDRDRCLAAGMDEYLSKPVHRDDLVALLTRIAGVPNGPVNPQVVQVEPPTVAFDQGGALARLGGDQEFLAVLTELFRSDGLRMLNELRESLASGDAVGVRQHAHGLKGSAGYVGGVGVVKATHQLELLGAAGDLLKAPAAFMVLEQEMDRLFTAHQENRALATV